MPLLYFVLSLLRQSFWITGYNRTRITLILLYKIDPCMDITFKVWLHLQYDEDFPLVLIDGIDQ